MQLNLLFMLVQKKAISGVKELIVETTVKERDIKEFVIRTGVISIRTGWGIRASLGLEPNLKLIQQNHSQL